MSDSIHTTTDSAPEPQGPAIRDSDLIYLAIKRLEAVAFKMQRYEYDAELDRMMTSAIEMFEWAGHNIARRLAEDES